MLDPFGQAFSNRVHAKNTTQCPRQGLKSGPLDQESSILSMRLTCLLACVAGRISRASAFVLAACEAVNGSGEAVGGLVKS